MKKLYAGILTGIGSFVNGAFGQFAGGVGDGFYQNLTSNITLNETMGAMAPTSVTVPTLSEWGVIVLVVGLAVAAFTRVRKLNLANSAA